MSAINGNFLNNVIKEIDEELIDPINEAIDEAGYEGYLRATEETPVDTGRMRSAWRLTKDRPSTSKPDDPQKPRGHSKGTDIFIREYATAKASAWAVAGSFDIRIHRKLVITNNMEYADIIDGENNIVTKAKRKSEVVLNSRIRKIL